MTKKRLVLRFPEDIVEKPIICGLAKQFNLSFSILKASVAPDTKGTMLLELEGSKADMENGIHYLEKNRVGTEKIEKDIRMDDTKCTSCGACISSCPTAALYTDEESSRIFFNSEKCIACAQCLKTCPYGAMHMNF